MADAECEGERLLQAYILEAAKLGQNAYWTRLGKFESAGYILRSSPAIQEAVASALLEELAGPEEPTSSKLVLSWVSAKSRAKLLSELVRRRRVNSDKDLGRCAVLCAKYCQVMNGAFEIGMCCIRALEHAKEKGPLPKGVLALLELAAAGISKGLVGPGFQYKDQQRALEGVSRLLGTAPEVGVGPDTGEPWADAMLADLRELQPTARAAWEAVFRHMRSARGTSPSTKWLKGAKLAASALAPPGLAGPLERWFASVREGASTPVGERNAEILKGLAWASTITEPPTTASAVADLCETCLRKIPNVGARSAKVANACLWALSAMPGRDAIAQLGRLQLKAKYATAKKLIGRALDAAAKREGMTRQDLEEIVVPSFGLGADGTLRQKLGEFTAEIRITGTTEAELRFVAADGKVPKSVPAAVKKDHAEELKALRRTQKDIEAMLPAQRERLERLLFGGRSWAPTDWRERFLDPPLLSGMARRLIWTADGVPAFPRDGGFVDAEDRPLPMPARLELWHPITSPAGTVLAWRRFLQKHEITQPFKQAHREIYAITPAEIATNTYSNRFAAHILRQHQFAALCQQRGWSYRLFGGFDSGGTPTLALPDHDLVAEFWVEGLGETLSQNGICVYISTDQVRFYNSAREQLRIETVPPRLFSEVMRNVDLFVGVCSIGGDPTWLDRGERREYDTYWRETSFGELTATAQSRSEVLSGLLPRLKIRDRCRIEGRFLVVKGDLRTYKIHLGSANILMEPNDQYLCIVPDRSPKGVGDKVFLPFEGDSTLSVILSKAFLLSDDAKIRDETILRQLKK